MTETHKKILEKRIQDCQTDKLDASLKTQYGKVCFLPLSYEGGCKYRKDLVSYDEKAHYRCYKETKNI